MRVERTTIVIALLLVVAVGLLNLKSALADPSNPSGFSTVGSERGNLNPASASLEAQAGNVTEIDINTTTITTSWAGFYGNVSGNITLQNAAGNEFYSWGVATPSGEVFASRNDSITWSTIACANAGNISSEESTLGQSASDTDSVTNTFTATNHPPFSVGTTDLSSCPTTNAYDNTGAQTASFFNVLLADGNSKFVYTALMNASTTGFDGGTYDFEILVGENGKGGNATIMTTMYFFVELN